MAKKLLDQACPDPRSRVERVRDANRLTHHSLSPNKPEQNCLIQLTRGLLTRFGRDACVASDTKFARGIDC